MMKKIKILSVILLSALLLSLTPIPVSAWGEELTVAGDYSYVEYNGEKYVRVDSTDIYFINELNWVEDIGFADDELVDYAEAHLNDSAIELFVTYKTGGTAIYYYVKDSLISDFQNYINDRGGDTLSVDYINGTASADRSAFFATELVVGGYELNHYSTVGNVFSGIFDGDIDISCGYLMTDMSGSYYYVDYIRSSSDHDTPLDLQKEIKIWQITDSELINKLKAASENDFSGEYPDYEYESDGGLGFGMILLIIILAVIPLAGAIVTLVLSSKSNKEFKMRLRIVSSLCLLAVVVTIITVIVCLAVAV